MRFLRIWWCWWRATCAHVVRTRYMPAVSAHRALPLRHAALDQIRRQLAEQPATWQLAEEDLDDGGDGLGGVAAAEAAGVDLALADAAAVLAEEVEDIMIVENKKKL